MTDFDVIAQDWEDALLEGDYTKALAIQTGMYDGIIDATAQQAYEAGMVAGAQAQQQQAPAGKEALYNALLDETQADNARKREIAQAVRELAAEEQKTKNEQEAKRIVDIHKAESWEHQLRRAQGSS
ncbi:MAG TPA: hypothetical protein VH643_22355 [Gemmataceae bacterium]|jgi:hypothetical protein